MKISSKGHRFTLEKNAKTDDMGPFNSFHFIGGFNSFLITCIPLQNYFNCSCIPSLNISVPVATSEGCSSPYCYLMPLFLSLFFVVMFLMFTMSSMTISVIVR